MIGEAKHKMGDQLPHIHSKIVKYKLKQNYLRHLLNIVVNSLLIFSPGTSIMVSSILLGLVLVGRAAFVFPLSFLSNLTKKFPYEKIGIKQQVCSQTILVSGI